MNELQVEDIIKRFKEQMGELTYQLIYRDALIEALQKQIEELQRQQVEVVEE